MSTTSMDYSIPLWIILLTRGDVLFVRQRLQIPPCQCYLAQARDLGFMYRFSRTIKICFVLCAGHIRLAWALLI